LGRWEDLRDEEFDFEVVDEGIAKQQTPLDRMKYAMSCKPMFSKHGAETFLQIAEACKTFDEMPLPMQAYVYEVEQEMGYQPPESIV
jgi:hypothetical protein